MAELPGEIVEAIAISNAKSIGEQPAILANLALSNQILNNNIQQQILVSQQQAMNQITMATLSKCVALITGPDDDTKQADELMTMLGKMFESEKASVKNQAKNSDEAIESEKELLKKAKKLSKAAAKKSKRSKDQ
ncbi:hypothetical protein MNBD_CHLOROFLEXI01-3342 [hydrothermal vent metagenome]|uniref:Uncharacterized protein n=1 Tax=hydrothermal vent metagenome TaxID=652676 RepID=A0A3B0VSY8_9ZZZZ